MHGDQDTYSTLYQPVYLQQNITIGLYRLHRYPDGKHTFHINHAEHFNDLIMTAVLVRINQCMAINPWQ